MGEIGAPFTQILEPLGLQLMVHINLFSPTYPHLPPDPTHVTPPHSCLQPLVHRPVRPHPAGAARLP
jgi:hypothetical protein